MGLLSVPNWLRGRFASDRAIFSYWDGSRTWLGFKRICRIDPFEAYLAIFHYPDFRLSEIDSLGADITDETSLRWRLETIQKVASCARTAFGLKPLSEGGLTNEEACRLLVEFVSYMGAVKKNGEQPQSLPPSAEQIPEATKVDLESGSIGSTSEPGTPSGLQPATAGDAAERSDSTAG